MTPDTEPDFIPATPATGSTGGDPDFIPATPTAAAAPMPTAPAQPTRNFFAEQPGTVGMGALKKLRGAAAGLVDMADAYMTGKVANTGVVPTLPVPLPEGGKVDTTLHTISNYLHQNTKTEGAAEGAGALIPDIAALANPAMWGEEGATEAMSAADKVLAMGRNLKTLEKNPGLLRLLQRTAAAAGQGAVKAAVPAAGITGVTETQSGDPSKMGKSALLAAAIGAPLEAIPIAGSELAQILKPTSEALEGATVPVVASQRPGASIITKAISHPSDLPAIDAAQQAAPDVIMQNGARRAVKNVLDQVNEARQVQGPVEASGSAPGEFKFSVDPIHPLVETEPGAQAAQNAEQLGSAASTVPQRLQGPPITEAQARLQATGSIGSTVPQRVAAGAPAAPAMTETTDPAVAQQLLTEAQRIAENPNIGPRLRARVESRIESLNNQFDQFHAAQLGQPNFAPVDTEAAIAGTNDYRTAGDIMQRSVTDVFQRMNKATDGEMSTLLRQPRWKSAQRMDELFDEHSNEFTRQEWRSAADAYRKGFVAKDLDSLLQKRFTVSKAGAADTADIGGARRFSGSEQTGKDLDALLEDHGDDLREMIGDEGIRSIRRMNQLLRDPEASGVLAQTLDKVAMVMRRHGGPVAGFIGHTIAPALGVSPHAGAMTGIIAGEAMSRVINKMASNPLIADRLAYAATHKVASSVAAPLIATMIMRDDDATTTGGQK